jgi:hypothetical protein
MAHVHCTCIFWCKFFEIASYTHVDSENVRIKNKKERGGYVARWGWIGHPFGQMEVAEPPSNDLWVVSATPIWPLGANRTTPIDHRGGLATPFWPDRGGLATSKGQMGVARPLISSFFFFFLSFFF